jgi:hypothetical protein
LTPTLLRIILTECSLINGEINEKINDMGLDNRVAGNYFSIFEGRFELRVDDPIAGVTETRVNKIGNTVHAKYFNEFTGKLVGIKVKDGDYGKQWIISFKDNGEFYHWQSPYRNGFVSQFLKMLPNVDVSKPMRVQPQQKKNKDGIMKSSLFINQDGQSIKHAYTKDNPNGLPPMTQVMFQGEKKWDDTEQMAFLEAMIMSTIVPKLDGFGAVQFQAPKHEADVASTQADEVVGAGMNPDDIPF